LDIVYQLMTTYTSKLLLSESSQIALSSLGCLFLAYPALMLKKESIELMKMVFNSKKILLHHELLSTFSMYLQSQQKQGQLTNSKTSQKEIDLGVLIGSSDTFSNDGIPTAIMQAFLDDILNDVLQPDLSLTIAAFHVISIIVDNGLVHPIKCIPAIVAMESLEGDVVAQQAFRLHQKLNEKHSSIIHSQNLEAVKKLYFYRKCLKAESIGAHSILGVNANESVINQLYDLVRLQKSRRNAFLRGLVNLFDNCTDTEIASDLDMFSFLADCICYLDFKFLEEVYHVIYHINLILSVSGEELKNTLDGYDSSDIPTNGKL
jgi:hypothetical protein